MKTYRRGNPDLDSAKQQGLISDGEVDDRGGVSTD